MAILNHAKSVELMRDVVNAAYGPPVTSDYIFDETATVTFLRTKSLKTARLVGDSMLKAFRILRVDEAIFQAAWLIFKNQKGTTFTFTDSTTIELMQQNDIRNIATFDGEFRRSGKLVVAGP